MDPVLFAVLGVEGICYVSKFAAGIALRQAGNPGVKKWLRKASIYPTPIDMFILLKDANKVDEYESELRKQNLPKETKEQMLDNFYAQL